MIGRASFLLLFALAAPPLPAQTLPAHAQPTSRPSERWWLRPNLRILTYEFLERGQLGRDLSPRRNPRLDR